MNLFEKPFQAIVIGIFAFLAILGLIIFSNFSGFKTGVEIGTVSIWGTLPEGSMMAQINSFKSANKDYAGVTYTQIPLETFDNTLANALASGSGPDLIIISQEQLVAEQSKLNVIPFSSISSRTYLDTFVPIGELFLTTTGTFGIPFVVDPLVLYYNRTILNGAGIAAAPTSWEAVMGLSERLTTKNNGQLVRSTISFGEYGNVGNARAILSLLLLQSGTTITSVNASGLYSSLESGAGATGVNSSQSAVNFYTQFADPAKTVYTWNRAQPEARQAFLAGDLALYVGFASELPSLSAGNPNLDFDMARIPQPQVNATRTTFGRVYGFAIPKASKNPSGAFSTAVALTTPDQVAIGATNLSMAPATRSLLTSQSSDKYQAVYFPEALISRGWLSPAPSVTDSIFSAMISNITTGRKNTAEAISTASQAINASL